MSLRCRPEPGSPGERLLSRRTWFDQMVYNALVEKISVRSAHEVQREERATENKAREEAKRTARKEAAARARRETVEGKRRELEEARLAALNKRTHKKRAAKKAAKNRKQDKSESREPAGSTRPEEEVSEELLRHIEEELEEEYAQSSESANNAQEEAKRDDQTEAAAKASKETAEAKSRELEAILAARKKRTQKKREAKKRKQNKRENREPTYSTSPEVEASEELVQHIEEELGELGEEFAQDETFYSSDEDCEMSANQAEIITTIDFDVTSAGKNKQKSRTDIKRVVLISACKESIQPASMVAQKSATEDKVECQQLHINELKEKAKKAEELYLKVDDEAAEAGLRSSKLEHDLHKAETTARKTAEVAKKAAETAAEVREETMEAAEHLASLKVLAQNAVQKHTEIQKALKIAEEVFYKEHALEKDVIVEANPLLDFLTETVETKSRELECPVCFDEASSPIYSCHRGHLICSPCRPQLSNCPECRQPLRKDWLRHRFAEKTADELKGLREKRDSLL